MTTKITITPSSHRVRVREIDRYEDLSGRQTHTVEKVLERDEGEYTVYATDTRTIEVVDVWPEYPLQPVKVGTLPNT